MAKIDIHPRKRVMVRAWGDRPVAVWLHAIDNVRLMAYVGAEVGGRPLGIPLSEVFRYEPDTFARTLMEYEHGTPQSLSSVYASLEHLQ